MATTQPAHLDTSREEPSDAIKERLVEDFCEFTGIDRQDMPEEKRKEIATEFLSQVGWDVQRAVESYLVVYDGLN